MDSNEAEIKNSRPTVDDGILSKNSDDDEDGLTTPINNSNDGTNSLRRIYYGSYSMDESDQGRTLNQTTPYLTSRSLSLTSEDDAPLPDFELQELPELTNSIPDLNIYQHKKTLAKGMLDVALFSANANQLRYILDSKTHPFYYAGIALISISLMFQVAIGVGLIWNSRYNIKDEREIFKANKINNFTVIGIFLVTVINVFISGFGVASV